MTYNDRIQPGLDLIDREYPPDWDERIDLTRLDMAKWDGCIGGQLEGHYDLFAAMHGFTCPVDLLEERPPHPAQAAFNPDVSIACDNENLTEAWRAAIAHRRQVRYAIPADRLAAV